MKMLKYLKNERGDGGGIVLLISIFFFCIMAYLGVDIYGYVNLKQNMNLAANETMEIFKAENIFDDTTRDQFNTFISKLGVDPDKVTITASPEGNMVQRGDPVEIKVFATYECRALVPLGYTITFPAEVTVNGLAHTFVR